MSYDGLRKKSAALAACPTSADELEYEVARPGAQNPLPPPLLFPPLSSSSSGPPPRLRLTKLPPRCDVDGGSRGEKLLALDGLGEGRAPAVDPPVRVEYPVPIPMPPPLGRSIKGEDMVKTALQEDVSEV